MHCRHKVLTKLATVVDIARLQVNKIAKTKLDPMQFPKAGQTAQGTLQVLLPSLMVPETGRLWWA